MAFLNSGAVTVECSLGKITAQYKDSNYNNTFKIKSHVHTDGSDNPVIIQTRDVSGTEALILI
jgi:hypothetical protein